MAGNLRVSMLFEADTGRARSAIAGLRGETDQLGAAVAKAGQGARTGGAGITAAGEASEATTRDFLRAVTATQSLDAVVGKLGASMSRIGPSTFLGTLAALGDASLGIDEIAADFRQATDEARLYQSVLDQVRAKYDPLFAASQRYEMELRDIAEAERMGALSAIGASQARERAAQAMAPGLRQLGQSAQAANSHLANLGFQANDIFMMMAAGQNPMMLAIQQGTQVSQVFGMMRKEGQALGPAIRSALMGMVSPMSLVTMGAIALGAFAVQSLMSMGSEAKSAEDAVTDMTGSVREFGSQSKRTAADIVSDFGAINPVLVEMQRNLTALAQTRSLLDLRQTFQSLRGELSGDYFNTGSQEIADLLGVDAYRRDRPSKVASAPVAAFQRELKALQTAEGPSSQLEVVRRLEQQLVAAAGGIDQMNAAQLTYYDSLIATESAIERIVAAQAQAQRQAIDLARATGTENTRMGGPTVVDVAKPSDPGKGFQDARC